MAQVSAQITEEKLIANDGNAIDWFGAAVDISDGYAIVGARLDDDLAFDAGSAYIYVRETSGWSQQQKLLASDGALDDRFGKSVGITSDYAVVGSHWDDNFAGSAYIFSRSGTVWTQEAKLLAADRESGQLFGFSAHISGLTAVIGASGDNQGGDSAGAAYVFVKDGSNWVQQAKLIAGDPEPLDRFGRKVAIDGDYIIVGSHGDDDLGGASGAAYIFHRSGTTWAQEAKLLPSDGTASDNFGQCVDITGEYAIVGAHIAGDDSSGAAYVFRRSGTTWTEVAKLTAGDPTPGMQFGVSVGITPGVAVIGAWLGSVNLGGSAYVFKDNGTAWVQAAKLVPSDGDSSDQFGRVVAITTDDAIIGAQESNGVVNRSGAAYIYREITTSIDAPSTQADRPERFRLLQNYPNPFNPSTMINYELQRDETIELTIHDVLGRTVRTLYQGPQTAGQHGVEWNGLGQNGEPVAGGTYIYRLSTGSGILTQKMILLK
jgi:hypothetical protein